MGTEALGTAVMAKAFLFHSAGEAPRHIHRYGSFVCVLSKREKCGCKRGKSRLKVTERDISASLKVR